MCNSIHMEIHFIHPKHIIFFTHFTVKEDLTKIAIYEFHASDVLFLNNLHHDSSKPNLLKANDVYEPKHWKQLNSLMTKKIKIILLNRSRSAFPEGVETQKNVLKNNPNIPKDSNTKQQSCSQAAKSLPYKMHAQKRNFPWNPCENMEVMTNILADLI